MAKQNGAAEAKQSGLPVYAYVKKNQTGDMQGVLVHQATQQGWRFAALAELLRICEHCLNCMGGPPHTHRLRAFYDDFKKEEIPPMESKEMETWRPEESNTFIIRVQHRQNASWQGSVQWVEGGKEQHFRSALELIKLMDEALEKAEQNE